jgi:hypothetical protein
MQKRIQCHKCQYYFVTWQQNKPHGCRGFNFKSKLLPSIVVQQSSNKACELYKPKIRQN